MSVEANKQVVLEHFRLMNEGKYIEALKDFSEDLEWWCGGNDAHGGTNSKQDMVDAYTHQLPEYFPNGFQQNMGPLIGEGDWVVAYGTNQTERSGVGKQYFNHFAWIFQFRDGKVVMFREYFDTAHARDALFTP